MLGNEKMKKILLLLIIFFTMVVDRETILAKQAEFYVKPTFTKRQINKHENYYDLLLSPGQSQKLVFEIVNPTSRRVSVNIDKGTAVTTTSGSVNYSGSSKYVDSSIDSVIGNYMSVSKTSVTLDPNTKTQITISLKMPSKNITGILAGGVSFTEVGNPNDISQNAINSRVAYTYAILARQKLDSVPANLNFLKYNPNKKSQTNQLFSLKVQNANTIYNYKKKMMQMAPNSNFLFSVPLNGKTIKPGRYIATETAYYNKDANGNYIDSAGTKFKYKKTYTHQLYISQKKAKLINNPQKKNRTESMLNFWMWIISGIILVLATIAMILLFLLNRQHRQLLFLKKDIDSK